MARLVHLARELHKASIMERGLCGASVSIVVEGEDDARIEHALYAMPVLPDLRTTYGWIHALRRWTSEKMIAIVFRIPQHERVYVGAEAKPHYPMTAHDATRWIEAHPTRAQIIVPRPIAREDILAVRIVNERSRFVL